MYTRWVKCLGQAKASAKAAGKENEFVVEDVGHQTWSQKWGTLVI